MEKIKNRNLTLAFLLLLLCSILLLAAAGCGDINVKYKLSFDSNGGTECASVSSDDITTLKIPSDPKKENFVFDGWFWDDGSWEKPFTVNSILDQPVSEYMNMTVYAKWKGVSVSVSMKNGETAETKQIEYGAPYVLPVPTGEAGDKFLGWATGADKKDFLTDEAGKSLSDCDFLSAEAVAVWKEGKIALTLNAGKGTLDTKIYYAFKGEPVGALPVPFLDGFSFAGWFTAETGGEKVCETSVLDGELTLYARYEEIRHIRITYDGNGGESDWDTPAQTAPEGEAIRLEYCSFRRDGCTFEGWECNGTVYQPYESVSFEPGEYVMKAVWKGVPYTVKFEGGECGVGDMQPQNFNCGEDKALARNAFTRRGYKFLHWENLFSDAVYTDGQIVSDLTTLEGDVVYLRAKWAPIQYTVVFKESAEAADGIRIECLYDQWKSLPDLYIEKEGHHLSAWQQTGASGVILGLGDHIYNLTETDGAVLVFYPKMELNRYTLVFGREEVSLEYGQEFELPEPPAKTGYEFAGWSFDSWYATEEYASGSYRAGEIVKNVTLRHDVEVNAYENWTPLTFTLRLFADDGSGKTLDVQATYDEDLTLPIDWINARPNFEFYSFYFPVGGSDDILTRYLNQTKIEKLYEGAKEGVASLHAIWKYKYEGSGTKEAPYLVENAESMESMAMTAFAEQNWDSTTVRTSFRFTADIDMAGRTFTPIGWYKNSECYGVAIEGGGHTVSNLVIAPPAWYEKGSFIYTGFINRANNSSVSDLTFDTCSLSVDISATYYEAEIGFIYGDSYRSSVKNVSVINAALSVTAGKTVLGGNGCYVGGLLGRDSSYEILTGSFFQGTITVEAPRAVVGGLAGTCSKVTACAAVATIRVTAEDALVAGLSCNFNNADNCYAVTDAEIQAKTAVVHEALYVRHSSGDHSLKNVYSCSESSFKLNGKAVESEGPKALVTREELKDPAWLSAHLPLMTTTRWTTEAGYPVPGSRELRTIEITTQNEFLALSGKNLCERYVLKTDVNLEGLTWTPASVFGEFDGGGHTISGFKSNAATDYLSGFFSLNYGTVCNLILRDVSQMLLVSKEEGGKIIYAGGVAAKNYGLIYACKTTGKIVVQAENCNVYVGGIAAWSEGTILSCYTDCTLTGLANENVEYSTGGRMTLGGYFDSYVNGIAYSEGGTISGCYTKGAYTANGSGYIAVAGVANAAEKSFSLADLDYRDVGPKQRAKISYVYEAAKGLKGCASQKINGVPSAGGILEDFFKTENYLTETVGMRAYGSPEAFANDREAAWIFTADGFPKLYFEA